MLGGLQRALALAAIAAEETPDGRRLLLPLLLANAGCSPLLCLAPGGVWGWRCCSPPLPADCGVPLLAVAAVVWENLPGPTARCPAGLPLLLAALLGDEPGKGSG